MAVFPASVKIFFGKFLSLLMSAISAFQCIGTARTTEMPKAPEDFVPAIRFIVCSDTHNRNDRVAKMIDHCYEMYDDNSVYAGVDVFAFCGDMTEAGENKDMDAFKQTLVEHLKGETQALVLLGNHELKNPDSRAYFTEIFGVDPEQHITAKGFHFISVSNDYERQSPPGAGKWAGDEVEKALADAPGLPVFTFQHPHNFGTVYGSTNWGSALLSSAWQGHSNVINFSGHSHYPMNDPRSIYQSSYTSLGCGGMNYFELEKDFISGEFPEGYQEAAQFYVVEADLDGSVKILCYDLISDGFFGEEYYIENVNDRSTFAYTYNNRKAYDDAPVWNENTKASLEKNENGEYVVCFDKPQDKFIVHNYKISVVSNGIPVYSQTHVSDYFLVNTGDTASFNLGSLDLKQGREYRIEIAAVNAYMKSSIFSFTYTVE